MIERKNQKEKRGRRAFLWAFFLLTNLTFKIGKSIEQSARIPQYLQTGFFLFLFKNKLFSKIVLIFLKTAFKSFLIES